ncbi:Patatin-like serine hydrolase [Penicillium longicatenatum]|uniref:Patatin-like serine hydrolase n=1 Tax=Penicillium longicatenatum TaxID=1561947 RepID=UPI002548A02A|nr:Patatin-like serine hydrolase [Penicillium longicatenatum]KAJ5639160.1 Patatin-like serine hydrolase [Penicillium longicatenatum]
MCKSRARATAAAPFFFTPAYLHGIGSFQDGGLKHNFPGEIAWQICRQIWPQRSGSTRMLSLGTGSSEVPSQPTPHFRHVFRDGFLRRGFNAWMSTMESERDSRRLERRLKSSQAAEYHRLNVPLKNVPESIDAIKSIEDYRDLVILQPGSARMAREAAMMLLISRFYFVLGDLPKNTAIPFWCRGFIHCKGSAKDVIAALQRLHPDGLVFVSDCGRGDTIADLGNICSSCGCCRQPITFLVRNIDQVISISLQSVSKQRWRISGFPGSIHSFAIRQSLESPFGRIDHGYPSKAYCNECDNQGPSNKRRRRQRSGSSGVGGSKRPWVAEIPIETIV